MKDKWTRFKFRKESTRNKLARRPLGRPRLSVRRSLRYLYAQIIDDTAGRTLAAASSLDKELKGQSKSGKSLAAAAKIGEALAKKAAKAGIKQVAFDRGGYLYHGRVRALAEAARAGGLEF